MPVHTPVKDESVTYKMTEDGEFVCVHESYHWETAEVDTMRNGEHDTYEVHIAVCDGCDETLEDIEPEEPDYE